MRSCTGPTKVFVLISARRFPRMRLATRLSVVRVDSRNDLPLRWYLIHQTALSF
jgi:hypothetical protein